METHNNANTEYAYFEQGTLNLLQDAIRVWKVSKPSIIVTDLSFSTDSYMTPPLKSQAVIEYVRDADYNTWKAAIATFLTVSPARYMINQSYFWDGTAYVAVFETVVSWPVVVMHRAVLKYQYSAEQ